MTERDIPTLPWWGGVYGVNRSARERVGGIDEADAVVGRNVRESALAADHTPVGRVEIAWTRAHPDAVEDDPVKDWASAKVRVRPNTVRKDRIGQKILDGTAELRVVPDQPTGP